MSCKPYVYYQGETVVGNLQSTDVDLDQNDFALYFYKYQNSPFVITKEQMSNNGSGVWQFTVPSTETATWDTGQYYAELVLINANYKTTIAKDKCFVVESSSSKGQL